MNTSSKHYFITIGLILLLSVACKKVNDNCQAHSYINAPKQDWFKSYNGSQEESHGHFILNCSDGGYLQVGETGFIPNSARILVIKTNNLGDLIWQKEFSNNGHNLGNSAIETDEAYLVCGSTNENSTLLKLNKVDGSIIFEKVFDNGGSDAIEHIAKTPNGYIAVGYVHAEDKTNTFYTEGEGYITFLNELGEKTSGQNISSYLAHAYRIMSFNNEYFISGFTCYGADEPSRGHRRIDV